MFLQRTPNTSSIYPNSWGRLNNIDGCHGETTSSRTDKFIETVTGKMSERKVERVVIAGGGTAGWMAAAALSRLVGRKLSVTLVESEEIGTVGVGEATIPTILTINRLLRIPEPDFIKLTSGTFKLGIRFENWRTEGKTIFTPLVIPGKAHGRQAFIISGCAHENWGSPNSTGNTVPS